MKDSIRNFIESPHLSVGTVESSLGEIVREGAEKLVKMAVMAEFENFFSQYSHLKDENGKQLLVRNGYHQERNVMTSAGNIRVKIPRVDGRDESKSKEERLNFHSKVIPPYLRRAMEVDDFVPYLYLKGISSGDFSDVFIHGRSVKICKFISAWRTTIAIPAFAAAMTTAVNTLKVLIGQFFTSWFWGHHFFLLFELFVFYTNEHPPYPHRWRKIGLAPKPPKPLPQYLPETHGGPRIKNAELLWQNTPNDTYIVPGRRIGLSPRIPRMSSMGRADSMFRQGIHNESKWKVNIEYDGW
jgi:hypothetical protein